MSSEWSRTTFDQLCDIKRGASPRPIHDWLAPTGIPWVKISDATASSSPFITKTAEFIRPEGAKKSVEVFPEDFILSNSATPGIPKFMQIHACVHDGWMLLRNFRGLDQWYCYYLLQTERENLIRQGNGSVFTNLKTEILKKHEVVVPPLKYQREVATFLRTLDDRITLLRETNATLEATGQALFKSWFVDFDPVHAKMEGRAPEGMDEATAALFPDALVESELGLVPEGWTTSPIYDLATFINGAAYKAFEPNSEQRGRPIIKIAELKSGVTAQTAYSDVEMPRKYLIETGDVLFSWSGNPDTSIDTYVWTFESAWLNQHIFRVLPHAQYQRTFVLQMLRHLKPVFTELARNKQTTGLGHVTVADMKRELIAMPSDQLVERFDLSVGPIHARIFENQRQAQTLATVRDTLLPRLISGQLSLPETEQQVEESLT